MGRLCSVEQRSLSRVGACPGSFVSSSPSQRGISSYTSHRSYLTRRTGTDPRGLALCGKWPGLERRTPGCFTQQTSWLDGYKACPSQLTHQGNVSARSVDGAERGCQRRQSQQQPGGQEGKCQPRGFQPGPTGGSEGHPFQVSNKARPENN